MSDLIIPEGIDKIVKKPDKLTNKISILYAERKELQKTIQVKCGNKACGKYKQIKDAVFHANHVWNNEPYNERWDVRGGHYTCSECGFATKVHEDSIEMKLSHLSKRSENA